MQASGEWECAWAPSCPLKKRHGRMKASERRGLGGRELLFRDRVSR